MNRSILDDGSAVIAVIGATDTPGKYGGRIYRDLKAKGFTVFAVNPRADTVDGDLAYGTVADIPVPVDIVDVVVPASVGISAVAALGDPAPVVWLQPGAQSREIVDHLTERGIDHIADGACIMVETRRVSR